MWSLHQQSLSLFLLLLLESCGWCVVASLVRTATSTSAQRQQQPHELHYTTNNSIAYGVDVSFPIHHANISTNFAYLAHNQKNSQDNDIPSQYRDMPLSPFGMERIQFYNDFMQGCVDSVGPKLAFRCYENEQERIEMSLLQPQSMKNFTSLGFHKIRAPESIYRLLSGFWNHSQEKITNESWPKANTYTNDFAAKSKVLLIDNFNLRSGKALKDELWDQAEPIISQWVQQRLKPSSLYGIRIYTTGAILATHVDRLPLVSSAIINVAQDVDEPWPLEVIGHDGIAYNITMVPGDMVLYESHSTLHGRPFPLKGRFVANAFVHFEPIGPLLEDENDRTKTGTTTTGSGGTNPSIRSTAVKNIQPPHHHESEHHHDLPIYIIPGSPAALHWEEEGGFVDEDEEDEEEVSEGEEEDFQPHIYDDTHSGGGGGGGEHDLLDLGLASTSDGNTTKMGPRSPTTAHRAARHGSIADLEDEIRREHSIVNATDENGWTPLHSGAHGGHVDIVKLLIAAGADPDAKTWYGSGGTALWWAKKFHGNNHPVVEFLESIGAADVGPEL